MVLGHRIVGTCFLMVDHISNKVVLYIEIRSLTCLQMVRWTTKEIKRAVMNSYVIEETSRVYDHDIRQLEPPVSPSPPQLAAAPEEFCPYGSPKSPSPSFCLQATSLYSQRYVHFEIIAGTNPGRVRAPDTTLLISAIFLRLCVTSASKRESPRMISRRSVRMWIEYRSSLMTMIIIM